MAALFASLPLRRRISGAKSPGALWTLERFVSLLAGDGGRIRADGVLGHDGASAGNPSDARSLQPLVGRQRQKLDEIVPKHEVEEEVL